MLLDRLSLQPPLNDKESDHHHTDQVHNRQPSRRQVRLDVKYPISFRALSDWSVLRRVLCPREMPKIGDIHWVALMEVE